LLWAVSRAAILAHNEKSCSDERHDFAGVKIELIDRAALGRIHALHKQTGFREA
jgi:hypothetical protein